MSNAQPNYYEVLGLSPAATSAEIKKHYRELARRHHPDMNPGPEAVRAITLINAAYHVLGDADRRAVYDAECFLRAQTASSATASRSASASAAAPPRSRPSAASAGVEFNGFGRTAPGDAPPFTAAPPRRPPPDPRPSSTGPEVERLVAEARLAYINRRYQHAEDLCRQALLLNRHNAGAHEVLGDIHARRGDWMRASTAYTYAIQFEPRNYGVQAKLDRLLGRRETSAGPTVTRRTPSTPRQSFLPDAHRERALAALSVFLTGALVGTFYAVAYYPGLPWIAGLSINLILALALAGISAGVLLALYGAMRPMSEELTLRIEGVPISRGPASFGLVLSIVSLVSFYASLLVYLIIGAAQRRLSLSVLQVYGAVLVLTGLFAFLYRPGNAASGSIEAMVLAGNALFPAMLYGWAAGDALRLRGR